MNIVVLTGAGISAESGVPTFRDADGLWEGHRVEDVATLAAFERDRASVQRFYDDRRHAVERVDPNSAHRALARLELEIGDRLLIVTQNIDDLHERAGSTRLLHMHGELFSTLCDACGGRFPFEGQLVVEPACPGCGESALRPDVVWFGEMPYHLRQIDRALRGADLFVSIGTSGAVYPAAGFVDAAREYGARTLELNLAPSEGSHLFDESRLGPATELVPAWALEMRVLSRS
jgi:NAD-dependent deacetylase